MNPLMFSNRLFLNSPLSRVALLYSSRFLATSGTTTASISHERDSLYRRISPIGDQNVSVIPVLDGWINEGNAVNKYQLQSLVKEFRRYRRFRHALEISEWMADLFTLRPADIAVQLDLVCKVRGLEHAEKYFNNVPKYAKTFQTYGALINCYAQTKSVEKAENLLQEMKELRFVTTLVYNVVLNLYCQIGQHEKLDPLMEEMEEEGIPPDIFTFSIRMNAYLAFSDIEGMENILKKMEDNPRIVMKWDAYSIAANGYIKAGLPVKALLTLKKSEALVTQEDRVAFDFLLTMYASIGQLDDVYRIWIRSQKLSKKGHNQSYISMIKSLVRLEDIEGAEKIVEEWESKCSSYDFRVPNQLIVAYCKRGLFDYARSFISKAMEKGKTPYPSTWECMATGYVMHNQVSEAVDMMRKALSASHNGWKPNPATLSACLKFFEVQGDVEGAEDFVRLLRRKIPLTRDVYDRLLRTYLAAGKPVSDVVYRMKEDGLDASEETQELLKRSCDT